MKKDIHPKLYKNAKVTDVSTGQTFTLASTKEEIVVDVTNLSHPFYTGQHRIVDTENLVKKFEEKRKVADGKEVRKKSDKRNARNRKVSEIKGGNKLTLKDMLSQIK
ncbi:MAG: 50S ribosomal protein L31 [Candidatus Dojkabacteria bacterium]|uniref:50S ribosomal protein L31 n=2 Tax=Candidatus Dojkabacteria TaxID=74243 RepID=A0A136KK01_9BACT|nr:MAG: 50S ribosomal protein L31 [candidate division WS6 bacterium OLB21]MBW7953234.1 50S ribosomal protein L31 [Candidatus Dojkabacteria bacterium]WKZ28379.1 MAG: 50S ribosomal protein L31 [Candidatus Dojkabacteria bacterium]